MLLLWWSWGAEGVVVTVRGWAGASSPGGVDRGEPTLDGCSVGCRAASSRGPADGRAASGAAADGGELGTEDTVSFLSAAFLFFFEPATEGVSPAAPVFVTTCWAASAASTAAGSSSGCTKRHADP